MNVRGAMPSTANPLQHTPSRWTRPAVCHHGWPAAAATGLKSPSAYCSVLEHCQLGHAATNRQVRSRRNRPSDATCTRSIAGYWCNIREIWHQV